MEERELKKKEEARLKEERKKAREEKKLETMRIKDERKKAREEKAKQKRENAEGKKKILRKASESELSEEVFFFPCTKVITISYLCISLCLIVGGGSYQDTLVALCSDFFSLFFLKCLAFIVHNVLLCFVHI